MSGFYDKALNSVERFNLQTGEWTQDVGQLNLARTKFSAVALP
jgi:N-acetylneuraminic acid mutarotase